MSGQIRFTPPLGGQRAVKRHGLLEQLDQGGPRRLTTIVAPAGYGKTSLAAQWYEALRSQGMTALWVGLETDHDNQNQFILVLMEALGGVLPDEQMPHDTASMSGASLLAMLATRLRRIAGSLFIFLDDYHFAQTDATESVVARLLADANLEHVKCVLISRSKPRFPISALRLNNELKHVGVAELAFSDTEAEEFFTGDRACLTAEQVGILNRRTEGWVVALQMVRVLVSNRAGADTVLSYFDAGTTEMGTYLSEQVFAHLPEPMRRLLVETAALPALSRDLVVAVSEVSEAARLFQELAGYALPIAVLGGAGNWIRYHPVFNTFLKAEAERQNVDTREVLRKAARWFERQGDCDTAVRHALLSDDTNLAARIVEDAGGWRRVYATTRGGTTMFQSIIARAADIDLHRVPLTTLGLSVVSAKAGQLDAANHYLTIAERSASLGETHASDLRVVRALLSLYMDRWATNADLSALEDDLLKRETVEPIHRALTLNMLSYNFLIRGELERALHYGQLAIRAFRDGNADFGAMHLYTHVGQAAFFSGDCATAAEAYEQLIGEAQKNIGKGSDLDAVGQVLKAEILSMSGQDQAAEAILLWALPHLERHDTWFDLLAAGFMAEQRILRLKCDHVSAHASIDRVHAAARRRGFERLTRLVEGERVILLLASGDVEQASRYAEAKGMGQKAIRLDKANNLAVHPRGTVPALLWTRCHLAQGDPVAARASLDQLTTGQAQKPNVPRSIELGLVEISLLLAEERRGEAAARLCDLVLSPSLGDYRAILRVEGEQFLGNLRQLAMSGATPEIVGHRLSQFLGEDGGSQTMRADPDTTPQENGLLTAREQRVVELLSAGLSNKEISRRLDMSDNTVKFHLRNIYAKLNVGTRLSAVNAAREKGVLAGR